MATILWYVGRNTGRHYPARPDEERSDPAIRCCGVELVCDAFTNTCDHCGADYNFAGQLLAPRSQWGEETGESWMDCY